MNEVAEQMMGISLRLQELYENMNERLRSDPHRRARPEVLQQLLNQQRALLFDLERTMRVALEAGVQPEFCEEIVDSVCQKHEEYVALLRSRVQVLEFEAVKATQRNLKLRDYTRDSMTSSAA